MVGKGRCQVKLWTGGEGVGRRATIHCLCWTLTLFPGSQGSPGLLGHALPIEVVQIHVASLALPGASRKVSP